MRILSPVGLLSDKLNPTVPVQFDRSVRKIRYSRFLRCWVLPYLRSRIHGGFRPILGCVYTDLKCNLDCPYSHSPDNTAPGMPPQFPESRDVYALSPRSSSSSDVFCIDHTGRAYA